MASLEEKRKTQWWRTSFNWNHRACTWNSFFSSFYSSTLYTHMMLHGFTFRWERADLETSHATTHGHGNSRTDRLVFTDRLFQDVILLSSYCPQTNIYMMERISSSLITPPKQRGVSYTRLFSHKTLACKPLSGPAWNSGSDKHRYSAARRSLHHFFPNAK